MNGLVERAVGPVDGVLLVMTLMYGVGFFSAKWLHERLMSNVLIAEADWVNKTAASGLDPLNPWGEE